MLVVLGVVFGALLLLWLLTALFAFVAFVPGEFSPPLIVLPWAVAVLGWVAVPVTCLVALDALGAGALDERSLLPPLAVAVIGAGVGLGALVHRLAGATRGRAVRDASGAAPVADDPRRAAFEAWARDASVVDVPAPWRAHGPLPIRGVRAIGFADDPGTGRELMLVLTLLGRGLFDVASGEQIARDDDPDVAYEFLAAVHAGEGTADPVHHCPGLGPIDGRPVRMVVPGLGPPAATSARWSVDVVGDGPMIRIVLDGGDGDPRVVCELPAPVDVAGFSWSGRTLVVVADAGVWWSARPWRGGPAHPGQR